MLEKTTTSGNLHAMKVGYQRDSTFKKFIRLKPETKSKQANELEVGLESVSNRIHE